jgi:hypothetical protein
MRLKALLIITLVMLVSCSSSRGSSRKSDASSSDTSSGSVCAPDCDDKTCGDDGCGGVCGTCDDASPFCASGQCVSECSPNCEGLECGDDGCGGACGTCPEVAPFCEEGKCQLTAACEPDCTVKECGDDGCGGSCGECGDGFVCQGNIAISTACVCAPQCEEKECGDDGCGGTCGSCEVGICQNNQCIVTCGPERMPCECVITQCGGSTDSLGSLVLCDELQSVDSGSCGDALAETILEQGCPALCSDSVPEALSEIAPVMKTLCSLDECVQAFDEILNAFGFSCSSCFE